MNKTEHLLTCLAEECAEIQKAIAKAQRFGLENGNPYGGSVLNNATEIALESVHIMAILELLDEEGVLSAVDDSAIRSVIDSKKERVRKYMEIAKDVGVLKED